MLGIASRDEEFLTVAQQAIATSGAAEGLEALGWWDLLSHLDDSDLRPAVFAFFRAQGRELASSVALGGLIAQSFLANTDLAPGDAVAAIRRETGGEPTHIVVGDPTGRLLMVDRPGHGVEFFNLNDVELRPLDIPGRMHLAHAHVHNRTPQLTIGEDLAAPARARSLFLGRVALSAEILGAAEATLQVANEYASNRQQFGKPIGTFQAIRHLLAWARTDCVAIEAVLFRAIHLDWLAPPTFGEVTKALAGRNGRRVCERTLQVLGGIGFTAEHDHHHLHSRILALDSLLGTSAELTHQLGGQFRADGGHQLRPPQQLLY